MTRKFFVIAGEESGDVVGADLIRAIKSRFPDCRIKGIGGNAMLAAGLEGSLFPMSTLSIMGIVEILPRIPEFLKLINQTVAAIEGFAPDAVVTIDSPDFCLRVQKSLKNRQNQAKRIHYVAPTVWAWRAGRAKKIAQFLDGLMCLYPFEPPFFTRERLRATFTGHPVLSSGILDARPEDFLKHHGINPVEKPPIIGFLCGSRSRELDFSIPLYQKILTQLRRNFPGIIAVFPTLPRFVERLRREFGDENVIVTEETGGAKFAAFKACDAAIAVSGTVALELAVAGVPHLLVYKMNGISWNIAKLIIHTKFAHLGNILLNNIGENGAVYQEFLQGQARADLILPTLTHMLGNPQSQKEFADLSRQLIHLLRPPSPHHMIDFIESVILPPK